ncbi:DNA replication protein DnaD [Agrilactobacillus yilanensis]|uniref:DNA replication protein DnaD n=1 Tax=Agrilactobacillus yilanensis TaxID=2485997 RepID=A0ABW4JB10_9LACO|nr:DNA replication protein DnaD [Agrilactobacillus yilanensis]
MDYFKQRRAYRKLREEQIDISMGQNALYRELLDYANDEGKLDAAFTLKNAALTALTGLSESGLRKARNELVEMGLLIYIPGRKNQQKPQYKIKPLYHTNWATKQQQSAPTQTPSSAPTRTPTSNATGSTKVLTSTRPLRDNNFKEMTKEMGPTQNEADLNQRFQKLWALYPRSAKYPETFASYQTAVFSGVTDAQIEAGILAYRREITAKGIGVGYITKSHNWFANQGWRDDYDATPNAALDNTAKSALKPTVEPIPKWFRTMSAVALN